MTNEQELKEWAESGGNWINAKKIKEYPNGETIVVITQEPVKKTRKYEQKDVTKVETVVERAVAEDSEQYNLAITKRDIPDIAEVYGWDMKQWIGKHLKLATTRTTLGY